MTLVALAIPNWASFEADWQDLQNALGSDVWLRDEDGTKFLPTKAPVFSDNLRFDFDLIENLTTKPAKFDDDGNKTQDAVTTGPHVNIQVSVAPGGDPSAGDTLRDGLIDYIRSWPWEDITVDDADLSDTDRYRHTLGNGSRVIVAEITDEDGNVIDWTTQPKLPKRVFG